jgi:hypothetical protein
MFNAQSGAVRTLAANMKFSMHSGGKAARAQIFREFSRSGKLAGKRSRESAVVHQSPAELELRLRRKKSAICQLLVNA